MIANVNNQIIRGLFHLFYQFPECYGGEFNTFINAIDFSYYIVIYNSIYIKLYISLFAGIILLNCY